MHRLFLTILLALSVLAPPSGRAVEITVFAAASLLDSLEEIGKAYGTRTGDRVVFSFAASGTLARQIEAGARADVFFPADEATMDRVEAKGFVVPGTRRPRLANVLVGVAAEGAVPGLTDAKGLASAGVRRVALGDPKTVPAGTYAAEYLTKLGLWSEIEKKIVPCENVRAVLAAVESGNVDAGIVYRTDAAISKKVRIAFEVPAKDGPRIRYPVARVKESRQPEAAARFLEYLDGPEAREVFVRRGFVVLPGGSATPP